MKVIKVIGLIASMICIFLIVMAVGTKNPEVKLYDETINHLMVLEGFSSEQEALANIQHLEKVKVKMDELANLKSQVQAKIQSPVPPPSKVEDQALRNQIEQIRQLRTEVRSDLKQLIIP